MVGTGKEREKEPENEWMKHMQRENPLGPFRPETMVGAYLKSGLYDKF